MTELDRARAELERLRRMVQEQEKRVAALTTTRPRKLVLLGGIPRIITIVGLDRIAITDGLGTHWGATHVKATLSLGEWGEAFELKWDAGEFYIETKAQLELTL